MKLSNRQLEELNQREMAPGGCSGRDETQNSILLQPEKGKPDGVKQVNK